ncbi:hypothetical protein [Streptomyces sp. NPDC050263]|uniref:hypothetical protein n=1 Tax=Streptomyces sp. NPDC050263 TaxID=3155037 RepID=UPI0034403211
MRGLLARHPDVRVRDLDTAAEPIVFTVELNTHKLMADPRIIPVETFETELADMVTRCLRGDQQPLTSACLPVGPPVALRTGWPILFPGT